MNHRSPLGALSFALLAGLGIAQLQAAPFTVTLTNDPTTLASSILGSGVSLAGTPVLNSQPGQSGLFSNFSSGPYTQSNGRSGMFNLASGLILTTGIASGAEGNYIGGPNFDASGPGDPMLSALSGGPTFDASVLSIPFRSTNPTLLFNFVFASSEYPSFVGSTFVDPLAISVNGVNVALVPNTAMPVSINSVNAVTNSNFFTQYSTPATPFNYGGVTTILTARANVSTGAVNTLRIAIADAVDGSLDSAVLIQGGSVAAVPEPSAFLLSAGGAGLLWGFSFLRRRTLPKAMKNSLSRSFSCSLLLASLSLPAVCQVSPTGAVFAMTNRAGNNEVVAFSRAADGTLTQTGRFSTRGNGIGVDFDTQGGLTLSPDHRFLYACNPGSDDVTVFAVNGSTLTFLQKIYAGDQPLSLTISGSLLYVLDGSVAGNGITGFRIAANGTLTPLPNSTRMLSSPVAVPGEVQFSPDGKVLAVTQKVDSLIGPTIDIFKIGSNGLPGNAIANKSFGIRPFAEAFKNDGRLLVIESGLPMLTNSAVSSYNVNEASGTISAITGSAKNGQTDSCWIVITKNQQYAYTANFVSGTISSYALASNGGAALISGSAAFTGLMSQPTDLAFDTETRYLYNLLRGTGGVAAFRVESNGSLSTLGVFGVGGGLPVADGASGLAAY